MSLSHGQNASVVGVVVVVGGGDTARDATRRRVDPPWHVASTYMEVSFNTTIDVKTAMIGQEFLRSSVPFFVFSICFPYSSCSPQDRVSEMGMSLSTESSGSGVVCDLIC